MILDLFTRCVLISLLAFGGGGAALPLIERIAVAETGWVSAQDFATAVAFGYITPGPVLITMTFLGYRAAGLAGAVRGDVRHFPDAVGAGGGRGAPAPAVDAASAVATFGRGAAPAVVGLARGHGPPSGPQCLHQRDACRHCRCGPGAGAMDETAPDCAPPRRGSRRGAVRAGDGGQNAVTPRQHWWGVAMRRIERLRHWARTVKRDVLMLSLAARDPRVPWYAKVVAACVAAYAFSPIDLIPDFIPVLGYLDDVIIVPLGILLAIRLIPPALLEEHRCAAIERSQQRPTSYIGAAIILMIWLIAGATLLFWLEKL